MVTDMNSLESRILELQKLEALQTAELKMSGVNIVESINPSNLIKSALKDFSTSPDIRATVLDTAIGIGAGFLGRKFYVGGSKNIIRKITGSAVQFLVTNLVRKKMPEIREEMHHTNHNHQ